MSQSFDHSQSEVRGLRHLALKVRSVAHARAFYMDFFGMQVVWAPDPQNVYLSSGVDNLALHELPAEEPPLAEPQGQVLDHLGFIMASVGGVDRLYQRALEAGIRIVKLPKRHRDDSYSFYLADPDGNVVQVLYEPTISPMEFHSPNP